MATDATPWRRTRHHGNVHSSSVIFRMYTHIYIKYHFSGTFRSTFLVFFPHCVSILMVLPGQLTDDLQQSFILLLQLLVFILDIVQVLKNVAQKHVTDKTAASLRIKRQLCNGVNYNKVC